MGFPYMNESYFGLNLATQAASEELHAVEVQDEMEVTSFTVTTHSTVAASTADHLAFLLEDAGVGTGSGLMSTIGGISTALTDLTPTAGTISEGTVNSGDAININVVETGTASATTPTAELTGVHGVPAGVG